tara:strand:+ start:987 stop:1181 length:195 start_codon:yes stop_codon:yes gene_type:complete
MVNWNKPEYDSKRGEIHDMYLSDLYKRLEEEGLFNPGEDITPVDIVEEVKEVIKEVSVKEPSEE